MNIRDTIARAMYDADTVWNAKRLGSGFSNLERCGYIADTILMAIPRISEPTLRKQIARDIEADHETRAKDPDDSFWAGYRCATETAARIAREGAAWARR